MFRTYAMLSRRITSRRPPTRTPGSNAMKAVSDPLPHARDLSGPAAAVLVALAGAALVAAGLLLVGLRDEVKVGVRLTGLPVAATYIAD